MTNIATSASHVPALPMDVVLDPEDQEALTKLTWNELCSDRSIPTVLLAIAELNSPQSVVKVYEATNLREHIKMKGWVDPQTKLPIKKITWVFLQTFGLNEPRAERFGRLDKLPEWFFKAINTGSLAFKKVRRTFLEALTMIKPLPHDWFRSQPTEKKRLQIMAEIFSRSCNPLIDNHIRARAQFITGMTLMPHNRCSDLVLMRNPSEKGADDFSLSPPIKEGLRHLACAANNGHIPSGALLCLLETPPPPIDLRKAKRSLSQPSLKL